MDEFTGKEQVLRGVVRGVVVDGIVPDALFRGRKRGFRIGRGLQNWSGGLGAFLRRRGGGSQSGLVIERVMEIDPESAVKLEDGKRPIREIALPAGCRPNGDEQRKREQQKRESHWRLARHTESHDSNAKSRRAQTRPKQ